MIQTLMALWNRGASGRLLVMIVTFLGLCISISLLFVTVGSVWGPLLAHRGQRASDPQKAVSNAVLITATAPPAVAPTLIVVTPTLPPEPCMASPTEPHGNTARSDETGNNGRSSVATRTPVSRPLRKTPTPGTTILPTPSPTLPAVSPTVTTQPTVTPVATNTPTDTPTPTATSTPGASPTPTVMLTPTDTSTPEATPTTTATGTSMDTPTVTTTETATPVTTGTVTVIAPAGSPTAAGSPTTGIAGRQVHDGRPQIPGTPGDATNGQQSQGSCLSDALVTGGEASLLSRLQDFIWVILVSSLLGTALFCAQMYRLSRKAGCR